MIFEILSIGLIVSACLALFLDEVVPSVSALAGTFIFISVIYAINGAVFAAVFQFAIGIGTIAVLFLSGEMLSEKPKKKTSQLTVAGIIGGGLALSLPAVLLSVSGSIDAIFPEVSIGDALWNMRGFDVVLQGLVIMTIAVGIFIVLYKKRSGGK